MPNTNIGATTVGNMAANVPEITVPSQTIDSATNPDETIYINEKASQWLGYYKAIPECKIAIDCRATWTLGKGYESDIGTSVILDHIKGWGLDSFNSILKNMIVSRRIFGDAFAEIIRWDDGTLVNLKVLDPAKIRIVVDKKGIIKRYEQMQTSGDVIKFKPEDIFHLTNKRICDQIHGTSDIEALEPIILALNEAFKIQKNIVKNYSKPKMMVEIDSDDTAKIAAYALKFDQATALGDNLFYPKGTVSPQVLAVSQNSTISVMAWRDHLTNYFYRVVGIPSIIVGGGGETFTESSAKISYLAFQQSCEEEQLDIEEQVWNQLYLRIELTFPASLQNEMISDQSKDGANQQTGMQASDMSAGLNE